MAVQAEMVNIGSAPQLPAYLAQPEGTGPFPAVIVIFEAFGLNENIKDITRRFAQAGFVGLAPDLYGDMQKVFALANTLPDDRALADIGRTIQYLKQQPHVKGNAIGVTSFCMGGLTRLPHSLCSCVGHCCGSAVLRWGNWRAGVVQRTDHGAARPGGEDPLPDDRQLWREGCLYSAGGGAKSRVPPRTARQAGRGEGLSRGRPRLYVQRPRLISPRGSQRFVGQDDRVLSATSAIDSQWSLAAVHGAV